MLKTLFTILFALTALIPASQSMAAQHQIAFQVWSGPVPPMAFDPASSIGRANNAFRAKYGFEQGLMGTTVGANNELVILVSSTAASRQIWGKMLNARDAYSAPNGVGYFQFDNAPMPQPQPPQPLPPQPQPQPLPPPQQPSSYQYLGRMSIAETNTGRFLLANGTPAVKGFVLAMDQYCPLVRAGVEVVGNYPVQPTRLVRSYRSGATTVAFEHSVNADQGALISAIDITIGNIGGPIIVDICNVDVYARF